MRGVATVQEMTLQLKVINMKSSTVPYHCPHFDPFFLGFWAHQGQMADGGDGLAGVTPFSALMGTVLVMRSEGTSRAPDLPGPSLRCAARPYSLEKWEPLGARRLRVFGWVVGRWS